MRKYDYEYGTTPRKLKPESNPYKKTKSKNEIKNQLKINNEQKKNAMKMEKRMHRKNVAFVFVVFAILLIISYRSSLINEKFNEVQDYKKTLSALEKTNGQLEVNIQSNLNLQNIENQAETELGMQKLDNSQKVYVELDKKDYVESSSEDIDAENTSTNLFQKIINKITGK